MEDTKELFAKKPWSCKLGKDKTAAILYLGKPVMTVSGKEYNKLLRVIDMDNQYELQLFLEKIAGAAKA